MYQITEKLKAVAESREQHILTFMERTKIRTIDFSTDEYIRTKVETIVREGDSQREVAISLDRHLLENKMSLQRYFVAICVVDKYGKVISSTNERLLGKDMSGQDAFVQGMHKSYGEVYVGQPHHSTYLDGNCFFVSAPIISKHHAAPLGVLILAYPFTIINEITTDRVGLGETGEVYLVNRDKIMLTELRFVNNASLKRIVDTEPIRKIIENGGEMIGTYKNYRGASVVGTSRYMPEYGWTLLAEMDKSEAFAPLKKLDVVVSIFWMVTTVIVVSFGIIFVVSISRPIEELTHAAGRFSKGKLDYRIKVTNKDEIGILASSFNIMADNLENEMKRQKSQLDALRKSEAGLANAQKIAHLGSWEWDVEKNVVQWSDESYRIYGLTPQTFSATYESFLNFVHPDDRGFVKESVNETLYEKKPYRIEFRIILPNGFVRIIYAEAEVIRDDTGKAIQMNGINYDITERKMMEKIFTEIKSRLEYLFANSPAVIYSCKSSGDYDVTFISSNVKRLVGYEPNEFIEGSSFWIDHIHPEDVPRVLDEVNYGIEKGSHTLVYRFQHKDGTYRWIHDEMRLIHGSHDNPPEPEIVGFLIDVTKQKHIEDEVKSVARFPSENPNPVLRIAYDSTVLYANLSSSSFLHDWKCEIGKRVPDFIFQSVKEAFNTRSIMKGIEIGHRGKTFSFTVVLVPDTNYVNLYGTDVTELKRVEKELRTLNESLEQRVEKRTAELVSLNKELQGEIAQHKQTANAFTKSEEKYRMLYETMREGIAFTDMDGHILECNQIFLDMLGYSEDEIKKLTYQQITPEKWHQMEENIVRKQIIGRSYSDEYEKEYIRKDGTVFPISVKAWLMNDKDGKPKGMCGIVRDITERKRAEEALKYRISFEMTVANISRRFTILKDFDDAITKSLADIGHSSKASRAYLFLFRDDGKIMDNTHEWCSEGISSEIQHLQNIPSARFPWLMKSFQNMNIIQIPDVSKMPEEAYAEKEEFEQENIKSILLLAIRIERELVGFVGFDNVASPSTWRVEDINLLSITAEIVGNAIARKRVEDSLRMSEGKYRLLLENLPQRVFYKDKNSTYISCNENFAKDLHIEAEEIFGKTDYDFFPKELADTYRDNDKKVIESGQKIDREQEYIEYIINGKESFIHMIKTPVKDEEGNITGILGSYLDITEKVVLQKEAERSKYLASLGELAAGVAHEINNPVTGVINCAQILFNKSQEESRERDLATRILKEGDRIAKIVHSLLSFARPGSKEEKNITNIHELLSDTLTLTGAQLRKDRIKLTLDVPQKLPEIVANQQLIQQVFVNAINNARYALNQKYPSTHSNKILEISGEEITIDHCPYIKITICDHGTGIPAHIRDKVMNPFFTTKPTSKGTGLGLSISHGIVKDHGGKLFIKSVEGEYTKLIIILPAQSKTA